ncbi:MAG: HAD-superfamily hydrolase, subfamily variant 3 [Solirubrobacterales bacterium]|nr:HAD-superfamily hydrolase, subfamily variant 3 [Solirubrobacterales bacterium]
MSAAPITTVVADFGGVLSTPLAPAFEVVHEHLDLPPAALGEAMAAVEAARGVHPLHELETGGLSEPDFYDLLAVRLAEALGREVAMHDFSERYWAALGRNDELIEHLRGVRRQGYRMGLLTNNVREWEPRWRAMLPMEELFDDVVDSAVVGLRKPDPAIYALTAERLGVPGSEIVFLDDFVSNCDAARAAGWTAVRFEDTAQTIAELDAVLAHRGAPPGVGAPSTG